MGAKTGITWADATWNPIVGCSQVSPGCARCYAKQLHDQRHRAYQAGKLQSLAQYAEPFENVQLFPERMSLPLTWRRPRRVFVNSLADLFHDEVPVAFIAGVWATMALAPRHTFQVLTKRPERMREVLTEPSFYERVLKAAWWPRQQWPELVGVAISDPARIPLPNVWLGVSIESQRYDWRAAELCAVPAARRFISAEPLLGPLSLRMVNPYQDPFTRERESLRSDFLGLNVLTPAPHRRDQGRHRLGHIEWVIVGGESGPEARPMDLHWARRLHAECSHHRVAFFFKQRSGPRAGMLDGVPGDLLIQEFPQ